jgi:hypothetical protein
MKTLNLRGLTGDALHAAVNEAVAVMEGWEYIDHEYTRSDMTKYRAGMWRQKGTKNSGVFPPYATSCDAVMPLLEKWGHPDWGRDAEYSKGTRWDGWRITLGNVCAEATTFPLAACIALLRANGVEVLT